MIFIEDGPPLRLNLTAMIDPTLPALDPTRPTKEERTWAMIAHLSAYLGHFIPGLGQIIGPLIVWLLKRDSSAFVANQAKEALNAQITLTILFMIAFVLCWVLIGFAMLAVLWIADVVLVIIAAVNAYDGKAYRYPFILRLVD